MGKFKTGLVKGIKEEQQKEKVQKRLHEKHRIQNPDILVVEKANMVKFMVRCIGNIVRIISTSVLFVLATTGATAFIYPQVRSELVQVLLQILRDIQSML